MMEFFMLRIAILLILLSLYFFPLMLAIARRHRNALAIGVTNFLFAFTGVGWVLCLIWACTDNVERRAIRSQV